MIRKKEKSSKNNLKSKNEIGITLIALIITIIILLILAGVTINLTLGENGIFRTAEMAGKNYMEAQERELAGLADFEKAINNIIGGTGSSSDTDTPVINYDTLKSVADPGDYVKYDTGITSVGNNGIVTFRVLYNDDTYGLQIISDKNLEEINFGITKSNDLATWELVMNDYNNAITTLNEKAEYYITNSPYALDGRCVGSVATIGADGKFNEKNTEVEGTYNIPDSWTLPSGWSSRDTGCKKVTDENYITDQMTMEALGLWRTDENYWLASHHVNLDTDDLTFFVNGVDSSGNVFLAHMCGAYPSGSTVTGSYKFGLRPCISLKFDVKVIAGDGKTEATAYELGI